ncbi:MAG: response regulator transcription factor [Anaerolineae bacterium]
MPSKPSRILIAEDEAPLRSLIASLLAAEGFQVLEAQDGQEALDILRREPIDLAILDVMMPGCDGFEVTRWIRERSNMPVIILTALGNTDSIVHGFSLGADDYITKPFTYKELRARLEAILRRMRWAEEPAREPIVNQGDITLDPAAHQATVKGKLVHLTPIETELLRYLMLHPGETISKGDLFRGVWGYDFVGSGNLVEVSIRRLREKIEEDPSCPQYIRTMRGAGYKFVPTAHSPSQKRKD